MPDFRVPDLGEGMTEAEVDRWLVKEGDTIAEDDILVELITDKATAEIPSPFAGTVETIHVDAGQVVPVGTVLVSIRTVDESAVAAPDVTSGRAASSGGADPAQLRQSSAELAAGPTPPSPRVDSTAPSSLVDSGAPTAASAQVKAMPPVRKLARELGVDLAAVAGSGPEGRILREDVQAAANGGSVAPAGTSTSAGEERREKYRGVRRVIGERMVHAHLTVPPVTHVEECDVTELDATRKLANERDPQGQRLTYLPFIVKAVVAALKTYPALNATLDEDAGEVVFHGRYDIGIAVETPNGLTVPVVRDADRKKLRELAAEMEDLAARARDGRLDASELRDGTFTVSSPGGPYGGVVATPIVFHPQSAILGVHRAQDRPVVRDGQIVIRKMMNLSVTFDHRILDGMTAARFVLDVANLLEHPAVLALES